MDDAWCERFYNDLQKTGIAIAELVTTESFQKDQLELLRRDQERMWRELAAMKVTTSTLEKEVARIQAGVYVLYIGLLGAGATLGFVTSVFFCWSLHL